MECNARNMIEHYSVSFRDFSQSSSLFLQMVITAMQLTFIDLHKKYGCIEEQITNRTHVLSISYSTAR